jgi:nucleoside-diphosphate-sugar epimerase
MRLLVIGGSGRVGRMVMPYLAERHTIRIFDLVEPPAGPWEQVIGSVEDYKALAAGMDGVDAVVYMAMNTQDNWGSIPTSAMAFDVNVKGLYLALRAAVDRHIPHAVFTSSLSVYEPRLGRYPEDEEPPDALDFYGLTKRLGEEVCRARVAEGGITITALRLCYPTADDAPAPTEPPFRASTYTRAVDVAGAILTGLDYRNGFDAITVSGDASERITPLRRAQALLGWWPSRPVGSE